MGETEGLLPLELLVPPPESDGVGVGVGVGLVVGSAVGDGEGEPDGLDDVVGDGEDDDCDAVGELDDGDGDGDPEGVCVELADGEAAGAGQAVDEVPGYCGRAVGIPLGLAGSPGGPGAADGVFEAPDVVTYTGPRVGVAVAAGVQPGLAAVLGDPPLRAAVVAEPLLLLALEGRLPLPAGLPPPVPPGRPGVCPPVSTVELTCTIACLNGGTARAMLAMKATPASTPIGRSQATPEGRPRFGAVARCLGAAAGPAACGSSRNRGLGRDAGQAQ